MPPGSPTESQSQFFVMAKQLADLANEKEKPSAKKLIPVLEELCTPKCVATMRDSSVDLLSPLLKLFRYDDAKVLALVHHLVSCIARSRASFGLARTVLEECSKGSDDTVATQTAVLRTLADTMATAPEGVPVPAGLAKALLVSLKDLAEPAKEKKKLLQLKATIDSERRARGLHHLSVLMAFQACHKPLPADGLAAALTTAVGHAKQGKAYHEPLIRESFVILRRYTEEAGEDLRLLEPHLPTGNVVAGGDRKDKKDKKKEGKEGDIVTFSTEDPFTSAELVRLCVAVLARSKHLEGRFAVCLKHLVHHPSPYVFSEAVSGILERGLFMLLLERDEIYAHSQDTVLDYVIFRVAGLLNSKRQLDIHVGLRLATALCEHTTLGLTRAHLEVEQVERLAETVHGMEATITAHCHSFCPHILLHSCLALWWLAAFFFTLPPDTSPDGIPGPQWAAQQQRMFDGITATILAEVGRNVNWTASLTTSLLTSYLKLLRAVSEAVKQRMLPAFSRLLAALYTTQPDKTDPHQLEPLLVSLLLEVDVAADREGAHGDNDLDVDIIAHGRSNGGAQTARLVLTLLETLQLEPAPVRDSAGRKKQWVRLLTCVVAFVGEYGNVMLARPHRPSHLSEGKVHGNPTFARFLALLQTLAMCRVQAELTVECVMALAKIAFRSNPDVRAAVALALQAVGAAVGGDLDHLIQPLVALLGELEQLQAALQRLQAGAGSPAELLQFLDKHEDLKKLIALYCPLPEPAKFKLLGRPSRPVLERAFKLKYGH